MPTSERQLIREALLVVQRAVEVGRRIVPARLREERKSPVIIAKVSQGPSIGEGAGKRQPVRHAPRKLRLQRLVVRREPKEQDAGCRRAMQSAASHAVIFRIGSAAPSQGRGQVDVLIARNVHAMVCLLYTSPS